MTHGGVIRGNYRSDNPNVPVITIRTTQPVTIDRCTLTGRGPLIVTDISHAKLVVRNTLGVGLNPNIAGKCAGRFLDAEAFDSVVVEHCELDQTAGIYLRDFKGDASGASPTVSILANRAKNIDGRRSDGSNGYLPFNLKTDHHTDKSVAGFSDRQFVQLDRVHAPRMQINWNYVTNEPDKSRVEDNINIYNSGGTANSPLLIEHNCVNGAYTVAPAKGTSVHNSETSDWTYTGGGIMLGDGSDRTVGTVSSFVAATGNVVIATSNYGIAISAGHDINFSGNTIVSSGRLPNGKAIFAQNVGAYIWDAHHGKQATPPVFFNNGGHDNLIRWMKGNRRNDFWIPDAAYWISKPSAPGAVTLLDEQQAEQQWIAKAAKAKVHVGLNAE